MKNTIFKFVFGFILSVLSTNLVFSQEHKNILKDALWLKPIESNQIINIKLENSNDENFNNKYFNFNPIIDFSRDKVLKKYKNIVNKKSSLFIVFKSKSNEEIQLTAIERGAFKSTLSNKKMIADNEIILNKGDAKTGEIVSYLFNKNTFVGKRKGNLIFNDMFYDDKSFENQLLELIYIPEFINNKQKGIVESYLSLKHGISLDEKQNYYNAKGDTIWNAKVNDGFNKRVTGIGKEVAFDLNQKQSKNAVGDGLSIGFEKIYKTNLENKVVLNDNDFIIWGDNNKNYVLEKNKDEAKKTMTRIWKLKTIADGFENFTTQIKIDKKLMPIEANFDEKATDFIWLAIDNSGASKFNFEEAQFIKASVNNEREIVFDKVVFNPNMEYLFTIIKAKESEIKSNVDSTKGILKTLENTNLHFNQYTVYPNPVSTSDKFNIQFHFIQPKKVTVQIDDVNGKVIINKDLGSIDNYTFNENLSVSGTYLIIVTIDGKLETSKLIVK